MLLGEESEDNWNYWRRVFDPTLISKRGYREIFFIPLLITLAAAAFQVLRSEGGNPELSGTAF